MIEQSIALPRLPSRSFVLAITTSLWSIVFAVAAADLLFAGGPAGWTAWRIAATLLSCGTGAGICLALEPVLRRHMPVAPGPWLGAAVFGACMNAVLWSVIARLIILPCARMLAAYAGLPVQGPAAGHLPTWGIALVFLAWSGAWLSVAFANDLSEARGQSERDRLRILELEAAIAGNRPGRVDYLWLPSRIGQVRIAVKDLMLVAAERDYIRLHAADGREFLVRGRLHQALEKLGGAPFAQIHRSTLVNLDQVKEVRRSRGRGATLVLRDDSRVTVSRRFAAVLRRIDAEQG